MTGLQRSLQTLFLVGSIGCFGPKTLAQDKTVMPPELNQNSSVSEIVSWLDRTSLANARVILKAWETDTYRPPWLDDDSRSETLILTQGFRLTNIDGCTLAFRNDNVTILPKSMKMKDSHNHLAAELYVPLARLSPTKGRAPFHYTKDVEKERLVGGWRTEFKYKGPFSRTIVGLALFSAGSKEPARWEGENLAFTFDSKETSEKFDAAFRRAIKLCRGK